MPRLGPNLRCWRAADICSHSKLARFDFTNACPQVASGRGAGQGNQTADCGIAAPSRARLTGNVHRPPDHAFAGGHEAARHGRARARHLAGGLALPDRGSPTAGPAGLHRPADRGPVGASGQHRPAGISAQQRAALPGRRGGDSGARRRRRLAGDHVPLPRAAPVELGAGAAAGDARLRAGLRLHRLPPGVRPAPDASARADRLGMARLLVPEHPLAGRCDLRPDRRPLSLCLRARPRRVRRAVIVRAGGEPDPGLHADRRLPPCRPAAGSSGHRRRPRLRHDGDAGRFRRGGLLRAAHLHHRHLSRLVCPGQPGRRGPARLAAAAHGLRHPGAGMGRARPGPLLDHDHAHLPEASGDSRRLARLGSLHRLRAPGRLRLRAARHRPGVDGAGCQRRHRPRPPRHPCRQHRIAGLARERC